MLTASVTSWIVAKLASCSWLVVMPGLHLTSTLVFHQTESSSSRRPTRSESRAGTLKRRSGSQVGGKSADHTEISPINNRLVSQADAQIQYCDRSNILRYQFSQTYCIHLKQIVLKDCLNGKCAWRFKLNTDWVSFLLPLLSVAKDFCTISQFPIECLPNVCRWLTVTANESDFFFSNPWLNSKKN